MNDFIGIYILSTLFFAVAMEFVAWWAHKYMMHGFLWFLHQDHHKVDKGFFQKNDYFFLIFAVPSWLGFMFGAIYANPFLLGMGSGILAYGLIYFLFHEVLVHRRFPKLRKAMFTLPLKDYFAAIERAHKAHHKHIGKEDGESFGLLVFNPKYLKSANKATGEGQKV